MNGKRFRYLIAAGFGATALLAFGACSSGGVSQEDYDSVKAERDSAQTNIQVLEGQVESLQEQVASTGPSIIIQSTTGKPSESAAPSGWDTEASIAAKVELLATYDSSGPAAWDAAAHPDVFITSEGNGYAGYYSETYTVAGFQIIDAVTKEHVVSAGFDLGYESMGTPHGLGVSPDGRWIYVPTGDGKQPWQLNSPDGGRLLVVDSKTLKLHQVIGTDSGPHHVKSFTDSNGNDRIIIERNGVLLLDPNDDHRVVFEMGPDKLFGSAYQVDADPAGENLYIGLVLGGRGIAPELEGAVAKVNLESGRITYIAGVGMYPNGFAFTSDGKFTYVADSSGDRVYKIDNATNKVIGSTQAAVPGPYMIELNHDESELWVIGKGEMTYNLGGSLGLIDTRTFRAVRDYNIGGQTIDHNLVNPADPTELWVTSSGTAEVIVFDLETRTVKTRIPDANGGDTHSGAFVHYNPDFTGEMRNDNSGARGEFLAGRIEAINAAASAR
jgi:DNA-binding beta-propeller fold protein YncE